MADDRRASERRDQDRRRSHRRTGGLQLMNDRARSTRTRCTGSASSDSEVHRLLVEGCDRALDALRADRALLDRLAGLLLEKEVVDRAELPGLMGEPAEQPADSARPEVGHAAAAAAAADE